MNAPPSPTGRFLRASRLVGHFGHSQSPAQVDEKIQVMLIDDSLTVRTILKRMIDSDDQMTVAQTASSAERGIEQLKRAKVDVILLDLEMPGMGGLAALPAILSAARNARVMVVSSLTEDGAEATVKALSTGAADTMLKPRPGEFNAEYRENLLGKIRALGSSAARPADAAGPASPKARRHAGNPEVLAIGASTGGIHALNIMMRALSPAFDLPIVITQHLPGSFIPVFARQIEVASGRKTTIAEDGCEIRNGEIAIAPGHGHMTVQRLGERLVTRTLTSPATSGCMPSVDPMLSSLARACDGRVLAIILSGMGRDGFDGAGEIAKLGGTVWAQDIETSVVWGMPGAVAKAGIAEFVATPEKLGEAIMAQFSSIEVS